MRSPRHSSRGAQWATWAALALPLLAALAAADNRPPIDIPALHDAQAQDAAIAAVDAQIARGEWAAARDGAAAVLARARTIWHGDLQLALVRLAFLEAKLDEGEAARFHWQALQAMGSADLGVPFFARFGAAADALRSQPGRSWGELPAGVVAAGANGVTRPQRTAGVVPTGNGGCTAARGPLWARLQLVVDADGRTRQPVIVGPSVCFSLSVLEEARQWTFAPARRGQQPVPSLYDETIHAPTQRPLEAVASDTTLAPVRALLAAGKVAAADAALERSWDSALDAGAPSRPLVVDLLALRALALAAHDDADAQRRAGCLWEAAQGEEPAFYDVDLAPFGGAGQRLASHAFGETRALPIPDAPPGTPRTRPQVMRESRRAPRERLPIASYASDRVLVEAIVDAQGTVRDPLLVDRRDGMHGLDLEALDAVCGWRYRPATIGGQPVNALYVLGLGVGGATAPAAAPR